jgi:hypothetical protein
MITETFKDWALSLSTEHKIQLLKDSYKDNFGAWLELANIYLEAPIHKGGLPTEIVDSTTKTQNNEKN